MWGFEPMQTLNESITVIAAVAENEELVDVKLFIPETATAEGAAAEFARSVADRRSGVITAEEDSPERVTRVSLYDAFPELASF